MTTRRRLEAAIVIWATVSALLLATDARPSVVALAGVVVLSTAVIGLGLDLWRQTTPVRWTSPMAPSGRGRRASIDPRVRSLQRMANAENQRTSSDLVELLAALVEDARLIGPDGGPARDSTRLDELGRSIRRLSRARRRRVFSRRDLQSYVTAIEDMTTEESASWT